MNLGLSTVRRSITAIRKAVGVKPLVTAGSTAVRRGQVQNPSRPGDKPMPQGSDFVLRHRFQPTPALSPNATTVASSSNVSGSCELWAIPVHGGEPRRGVGRPGRAVRQMAWTPDGEEVVLSTGRGDDGQYRLYRVPVEISCGGDHRRVLQAAPFGTTGRFLAYAVNDRDPHVHEVFLPMVPAVQSMYREE